MLTKFTTRTPSGTWDDKFGFDSLSLRNSRGLIGPCGNKKQEPGTRRQDQKRKDFFKI